MYHPNLIKNPDEHGADNMIDTENSSFDWDDWKENSTKGAMAGREKGFWLLLDVESFDYNGAQVSYEGFHVVVGSYHDQAIVNQRAIQIAPGTVSQIALTPSLSSITNSALSRFSPKKRQCYAEDEIGLTYFPLSRGYMYSMDNCIFEATVQKVVRRCNCHPPDLNFHNETPCRDMGMTCMEYEYDTLKMEGNIVYKTKQKNACRYVRSNPCHFL